MSFRSSLPAELIARLEQRIERHAGLSVPTWVLEARLNERTCALALAGVHEYIELVCGAGAGELDHLVEALRVGETRFFRHRNHVRALTDVVLPALHDKPGRNKPGRNKPGRVRMWSAGCATGEEAYTLAMLCAKQLPRPAYDVEILATDISEEALTVARRATYSDDALQHVPQPWRAPGFCRNDKAGDDDANNRWRITPAIAELVTFNKHNLADGRYPTQVDVILCRNVLIYFSPEARAQVVRRLLNSLNVGGFLFVGYSETLREFSQLEMVQTPTAVLYRKAANETTAPTRPAHVPTGASTNGASTNGASTNGASTTGASTTGASTAGASTTGASTTNMAAAVTGEVLVELRGRYDDGDRLAQQLTPIISGSSRRVVITFDGADYLCEDAAAVLRRAQAAARSAGQEFRFVATRPGPLRWLRRGGFVDKVDAEVDE